MSSAYCESCGEVFAPEPGVTYCRVITVKSDDGNEKTECWCYECVEDLLAHVEETYWAQEGGIE